MTYLYKKWRFTPWGVIVGVAIFAPELLLFGPITEIVALLLFAATAFIAAGIALLAGDKELCMMLYAMGIAWMTLIISGMWLIWTGLLAIGFVGIPPSASDACYCQENECY